MTDEELDLYFEQLGQEMRPTADLIVRLKADWEKMPARTPSERKAKFAKEKQLRKIEDDFCAAFNRDESWQQFRWPDGLTVRFEQPSLVTLKDGTQKLRTPTHAAFPTSPPTPQGLPTIRILPGVRPVFSRNEP